MRPWLLRLLTLVLAVAGFWAGLVLTIQKSPAPTSTARAFLKRPQPGTELLAVFVASSTCGASRFPSLPGALDDIRQALRSKAAQEGKLFVSIGVAVDQDPWMGIDFLKTFGHFDEILTGGNWLNTGSLAYVIRDLPGQHAVPQVVLVERAIELVDGVVVGTTDQLLARKVGADAIMEFAQLLAPSAAESVQKQQ